MTAREKILAWVDGRQQIYREIALQIHARPETSNHEAFACGLLSGQLRREGFFKDVDAALCVHPGGNRHQLTHAELACAPIRIAFSGKASHAAALGRQG